jgi:hypothetical protein
MLLKPSVIGAEITFRPAMSIQLERAAKYKIKLMVPCISHASCLLPYLTLAMK